MQDKSNEDIPAEICPPTEAPMEDMEEKSIDSDEEDLVDALNIVCGDCGVEFWYTKGEAKFYTARNWEAPTRCKACRKSKKERMGKKGKAYERLLKGKAKKRKKEQAEARAEKEEKSGNSGGSKSKEATEAASAIAGILGEIKYP